MNKIYYTLLLVSVTVIHISHTSHGISRYSAVNSCRNNSTIPQVRQDECIFPHEERYDCGYSGITQEECEGKGCCHNSSVNGTIAPHCFYPQAAECEQVERFDCGYNGISVHECYEKGCCFDNSQEPICFFKQLTECGFPAIERYDCGYDGIGEEECINQRGCCFDASIPDTFQCFYKQRSACEVPNEEKRDCGFIGISEEECLARECCHIGVSGYPTCYPTIYDPFTKFKSTGIEKHDIWFLTHRTTFSFTVRACKNVYVHLRHSAYSDSDMYKIRIGHDNLNDISMEKYLNDQMVSEVPRVEVPELLNCEESRSFYVEWTGGIIKVGRSSSDILLHHEDSDPLIVVEVRLYTLTNTHGFWQFNNNMARATNIAQRSSSGSPPYDQLWMELKPTTTSISFSIWSVEEAYLLLAENYENKQIVYEIAFGTADNQQTYVLDKTLEKKEIVSTPGILKGYTTPVALWVDWKDKHIRIGFGHVVGQEEFFTHYFEQSTVNAVRFISLGHKSSDSESFAYFTFRYNYEPLYYFRTPPEPDDPDMNNYFVKRVHFSTHKSYVIFSVQACKSAHVYLVDHSNRYRVEAIVGATNNTETLIREYKGSKEERRSTPDIISCSYSTTFWLSWFDKIPTIGRGRVVGEHTLIKLYDLSLGNDVVGIGFRTSETIGEWEIPESEVVNAVVQPVTQTNHEHTDFWRDVTDVTHTFVRIKACEGVHLVFSSEPGVLDTGATAEVILGSKGNTENFLLDGLYGPELDTYHQSGMLDCNTWYWFWFSWGGDTFDVGTGSVLGANEMMSASWDDFKRHFTVRSLGVAAVNGYDHQSIFEFREPEGEIYTFFSKSGQNRDLILLTERPYIAFQVQACYDARVILLQNPDLEQALSYVIYFGTEDNNHISIKQDAVTLQTKQIDDVLDCNTMHAFWITWEDKKILIGQSAVVGEEVLLEYKPANPADFIEPLHAVKLETYDTTGDGRWQVTRDMALSSEVRLESGVGYLKFWMGVEESSSVVFSVRSQLEAHIALSETSTTPGLYTTREIILKDVTQLKIKSDGSNTNLVEAETPGILSEDEFRYFWISWWNGYIQVGKGSEVGLEVFLQYQEPSPLHFSSMAISSGGQSESTWIFPGTKRTFSEIKTRALVFTEFRYKNIHAELKVVIQACKNAHIAMYGGPDHNSASKSYTLVIGGEDNTLTYIVRGDSSSWSSEQEISSPEILHCYQERAFTISWGVGGISVSGDDGFFFSWTDPEYLAVDFLSFGTENTIGYWLIARTAGDEFYVETYDDGYLRSAPNPQHNYQNKMQKYTDNIPEQLNHEHKDRDISHSNKDIKTSLQHESNERAEHSFVNHIDSPIKQTKARSDSNSERDNPPMSKYVPGLYKYSSLWMSVRDVKATWFMVQACSEAHVILTKYYGIADFDSYEVRIGEHNNQYINIYANREEQCTSHLYEDILDCQKYVTFWLRWSDDLVEIGQGHVPGSQPITSCEVVDLVISGLSVGSAMGQEAYWLFQDVTGGEATSFWTTNDYPEWGYNTTWVTPRQKWFTFEVQTNEWATVALSFMPRQIHTACYEIHIGKQDTVDPSHQVSFITDKDLPEYPVVYVKTPNAITSGALQSFWISWETEDLIVGFGSVRNLDDYMMKAPKPLYSINGLGFATPRADSRWQFPRDLARQTQVTLPSTGHQYEDFEVALRGLSSIVFQVKANGTVYVAMEMDNSVEAYTVVIGADLNQRCRLLDTTGNIVVEAKCTNILYDQVEQTYWIAWNSAKLEFGRGGQIDREVVFSYEITSGDTYELAFKEAVCYSRDYYFSEWTILELLGMTYNIWTPSDHRYEIVWMYVSYHTSMEFRVRACNDAHILLATEEAVNDYNNVYEIVIGGGSNTGLYIRKNSHVDEVETALISNLLDCNALMRYWVSWESGNIKIGSGYEATGNILLSWQDPEPITVNYATVSTGWNADGEWEIRHTQSERLTINTPPDETFPYNTTYMVIQGDDHIRFEVQACAYAQIALQQIPATVEVLSYEVVLGHQDGHGVALRTEYGGEFQQIGATDVQILSCDSLKEFWLSWHSDGTIRIGQGLHSDQSELYAFTSITNTLSRINAVAFKTDMGNSGKWIFHGSGRMYPYPGEDTSGDGNGSSGGLSGGAIFGIILAVLVAVLIIVVIVFVLFPSFRVKANQMWIDLRARFHSRNTESIDPTILASEVGFGEEHTA